MVHENGIPDFWAWLPNAGIVWVKAVLIVSVVGLILWSIIVLVQRGPEAAARSLVKGIGGGVIDLFGISPRRVWALTRLAYQESIRRRVLVVLAIFLVILLFAGWFLDPTSKEPGKLYLTFVLTATSYLVLLLALFLSSFSLPTEIQSRVIYGVATKPVRKSEIVLGRILGFIGIGTLLLVVMGAVSYFFVHRMLQHSHQTVAQSVEETEGSIGGRKLTKAETTFDDNHLHTFTIDAETGGMTDTVHGHWHQVTPGDGGELQISSPQGTFSAKVPIYGTLEFRDRAGQPAEEGVNVGNEWTYRSFIEGGTRAAAIWQFAGLTPQEFPDGLPLQMSLRVFRTHKGDQGKGILGSIVLINPSNPAIRTPPINFVAQEYSIYEHFIPRTADVLDTNGQVQQADIYEDLIGENGSLMVEISCLQQGQYFGMARPDIYVLARDASFAMNLTKGYFGIWLQMMVVICLGVLFSTFLNGAVAMMATIFAVAVGFHTDFVGDLVAGRLLGGGPFESMVRLYNQGTITLDLEPGIGTTVVHALDRVAQEMLGVVVNLLPSMTTFGSVDYVAEGFDIPPDLLGMQILTAFGFVVPIFIASYFILRSRELAK